MPDHLALHEIHHVLRHICSQIRNALQMPRHENQMHRPVDGLRILHHIGQQLPKHLIPEMIHLIVPLVHASGQLRIPVDKRIQTFLHHGLRQLRHPGNIDERLQKRLLIQLQRAFGDIDRLIRHPLQVVVDLHRGRDKPQIHRDGLPEREQPQTRFLDHHLHLVNPRILLDLLLNYKDKSFMMGEIANVSGGDKAVLHVRIAGTAPIQRVDVFNGTDLITTMHPYKNDNLGRRYKITWNGARVKGQDRVLRWDGGLQVEKNTIEQALPINFWNPDYPLEIINNKKLKWNSFTTGTAKGVLLTMEKSARGRIHFETSAAILDIDLGKIGLKPLIWDLGFLEKSVRVDRLPDKLNPREFAFQLPISGLKDGDNPIFIRLVQEDGQKACQVLFFLSNSGEVYTSQSSNMSNCFF